MRPSTQQSNNSGVRTIFTHRQSNPTVNSLSGVLANENKLIKVDSARAMGSRPGSDRKSRSSSRAPLDPQTIHIERRKSYDKLVVPKSVGLIKDLVE